MVEILIQYEGDLHCTAQHAPSGARLTSDAPVDNQGRGQAFSPTDLVATALGTCMATVMGIVARKRGYPLTGTQVQVQKHMSTDGPRRIVHLAVAVTFPHETSTPLDAQGRKELEHAALTCPVRLSLNEAIEVPVTFNWG